ncbi:MAG: DNA polymerase/3'-5' exonuclease PolX [Chloroflexi bacterium]|nr:DNA polymerase/3'-5' exonuclease PolX [Chloroflexota bacterium]MCL5274659.1 DNA polymerase/3'-5' exonuclease PolX [Chloroflexota bacterium]
MPLSNQQLATIFSDIADRLEIQGEVVFKTRAYRTIAENLQSLPRPVADIWKEGKLDEVPGIGKAIHDKIDELLRTGKLEFYERLRADVPDGVVAMLQVSGLGPKRVKEIWSTLGVMSLAELEAAARAGRLRGLPKMGEKTELKILAGIESLKRRATGRMRIGDVLPIALQMRAALQAVPGVQNVAYAGSLRRGRETIGDVDFVAATREPAALMEAFRSLPQVESVLGSGETKTSVQVQNGLQVDLRAIDPAAWGTAMQYFTGSQAHNIRAREIAQKQHLSLNEYALTPIGEDGSPADQPLTFDSEEALYARLGMAYIPPELREDRGEIEAAMKGTLPRLIAREDLRGDLQMHSTWSDGAADVLSMARGAMALGYEYILITDHSQSLGIANGLTPERVRAQRQEIDAVNQRLRDEGAAFRVLQGVEVEVKSDGVLDLPDDVLAELDLVQASVHTSLSQPRERITERALSAMRNPHVDILGHPSGRLINEREAGDYDWEKLFAAAAEHDVALEINADPARLDLNETHARRAVELGCHLSISTDAHTPDGLNQIIYGLGIARRAWVTPDVVINTWPLKKLLAWAQQ